ncbi:MAG TPA: PIN domain-containing protein [Acidobacteriaceae bacterium]|nr:PIN domain-containing protein [Acidobacteriaceae bacterium]
MSGRTFVDTNIFIYSYDARDPVKQSKARQLIEDLMLEGTATVSYQVVHEFFQFALVKAAKRMSHRDAHIYLEEVFRPIASVPSTISLVSEAIRIQERYLLSWYDSLIVAAAQQAGCGVLYSEDLQHGQRFGDLTVRNPFL